MLKTEVINFCVDKRGTRLYHETVCIEEKWTKKEQIIHDRILGYT